jgi:hypothetical protein
MIEIEEDNVAAKTTTTQLSKTYCEGYTAFVKGEFNGNVWSHFYGYPNTSQLGTYETFKESVRQQVLRSSASFKEGEQMISIKFSKVVLSE